MMKKMAVYALAVLSILAMTACGADKNKTIGAQSQPQSQASGTEAGEPGSGSVQMPNPWQEAADMQEAEKLAGFSLKAPEKVKGLPQQYIQVMTDEEQPVVEISYSAEDAEKITVRKAPGEGDISGVYGDFVQGEPLQAGNTQVSVRSVVGGDSEAYVLANWCSDGYTYAVYVPDGLTGQEMAALAAEIE